MTYTVGWQGCSLGFPSGFALLKSLGAAPLLLRLTQYALIMMPKNGLHLGIQTVQNAVQLCWDNYTNMIYYKII